MSLSLILTLSMLICIFVLVLVFVFVFIFVYLSLSLSGTLFIPLVVISRKHIFDTCPAHYFVVHIDQGVMNPPRKPCCTLGCCLPLLLSGTLFF